MVDHLDVTAFAHALGPNHVLLVRGHSSTWEHGRDHAASGLIDVTGYPDVTDLLLVADVLITDYSSVMFDWVSTGRPIVFFVPDLPSYRDDSAASTPTCSARPPAPSSRPLTTWSTPSSTPRHGETSMPTASGPGRGASPRTTTASRAAVSTSR